MTLVPRHPDHSDPATIPQPTRLRLAFLKAIAPIERDTLLFDLTDDEVDSVVAAIATEALASPPKHRFWGAGEADCPREIKAGNGELHTLRCKVCGVDSPRDGICRAEGGSMGDEPLFPLAHAAALRGAADDFLNAMSGNQPAEQPTIFYVQFSDDASAIRRWSLEDFDGAMRVEKSA